MIFPFLASCCYRKPCASLTGAFGLQWAIAGNCNYLLISMVYGNKYWFMSGLRWSLVICPLNILILLCFLTLSRVVGGMILLFWGGTLSLYSISTMVISTICGNFDW